MISKTKSYEYDRGDLQVLLDSFVGRPDQLQGQLVRGLGRVAAY
jgi:hypothetical protein